MPRKRIYTSNAEKQKTYRFRKKCNRLHKEIEQIFLKVAQKEGDKCT